MVVHKIISSLDYDRAYIDFSDVLIREDKVTKTLVLIFEPGKQLKKHRGKPHKVLLDTLYT